MVGVFRTSAQVMEPCESLRISDSGLIPGSLSVIATAQRVGTLRWLVSIAALPTDHRFMTFRLRPLECVRQNTTNLRIAPPNPFRYRMLTHVQLSQQPNFP
jgi:hypothetical protein